MKITDISFGINESGIEFNYTTEKGKGTAYLQLPDTSDSRHQIDGTDDEQREIYAQLERFYFDDFKNGECAAASAVVCATIVHIEKVQYKNNIIYAAFDEYDKSHLLVESDYKDYYNKRALFEKFEFANLSNIIYSTNTIREIEEIARKQR